MKRNRVERASTRSAIVPPDRSQHPPQPRASRGATRAGDLTNPWRHAPGSVLLLRDALAAGLALGAVTFGLSLVVFTALDGLNLIDPINAHACLPFAVLVAIGGAGGFAIGVKCRAPIHNPSRKPPCPVRSS